MLRELVEIYARRAREFSDTVARLGQHNQIGPEISGLIIEIRRKGGLCSEAAEELDRYLEQESVFIASETATAGSASAK